MATHYNLVFRGAVHKDQHAAVVRGRLQKLLKASDAQLDVMFSGKPVTIKKAADEPTAERYLDAFVKAGAKLELVEVAKPVAPAAPTAPEQTEPAGLPTTTQAAPVAAGSTAEAGAAGETAESAAAFQLAEVGANLVPATARTPEPETSVATDHLSLASPGTNLGEASSAADVVVPSVDTSHLQLDQPGVRLGVPVAEPEDIDAMLNFDFELGDIGEVLVESTPPVEPELPDLSHLQLENLPLEEPEPQEPA